MFFAQYPYYNLSYVHYIHIGGFLNYVRYSINFIHASESCEFVSHSVNLCLQGGHYFCRGIALQLVWAHNADLYWFLKPLRRG